MTRKWLLVVGALVLAFAWPLYGLLRFSFREELYSHVLLIPLISGYLAWTKRESVGIDPMPNRTMALVLFALGICMIGCYGLLGLSGQNLRREDAYALTTFAFVLLFWGVSAWFFSPKTLRAYAFPLLFLLFMVPLPHAMVMGIESILQHGSASVAYAIFKGVGTPVFRQDLIFQLPGITLEVAPECSGIRSSLALFITSVVAGYLFLRSPWKRTILALSVLPLALLRNGFRVFTIGELCVQISPDMIHSFIHRNGGPIFFVLSLIPFGLVLWLLVRSERNHPPSSGPLSSPI